MKHQQALYAKTVRGHLSTWERILLLTVALVVSAVPAGSAGAAQTKATESAGRITKGPCLLRVSQERVALMWETDTKGPWRLSYGENGKLDAHYDSRAEPVTYGANPKGGGEKTVYLHKVWMRNLRPGRTYGYRISGSGMQSEAYTFRTIPARTDEVRFIVYGDNRTQSEIHRRLVEQMMKHEVDFVVNGGDLVTRGDNYEQWGPQFFAPLRGLVERVPIYTAKGNHDGSKGIYEKLLIPPGEHNDSRIDYGPLHYFLADNATKGLDSGRVLRRMLNDATASKAPWKFISYHMPSVNLGGHRSDWQQKDALPGFAVAGVDFVITGHSHLYERFRPVAPPTKGGYVTYITSGGGGAPPATVTPASCHASAQSTYHFCLFHIKGDALTMDTIDVDGRVIDHLEITKNGGHLNREYLSTAIRMADIPQR